MAGSLGRGNSKVHLQSRGGGGYRLTVPCALASDSYRSRPVKKNKKNCCAEEHKFMLQLMQQQSERQFDKHALLTIQNSQQMHGCIIFYSIFLKLLTIEILLRRSIAF